MSKYRKKPVVIEAFQMTKGRRWDNSEWPEWLHIAWTTDPEEEGSLFCFGRGELLYITTLEGRHEVTFDDYIIQGVHGEIYPCKPKIFHATYLPESE